MLQQADKRSRQREDLLLISCCLCHTPWGTRSWTETALEKPWGLNLPLCFSVQLWKPLLFSFVFTPFHRVSPCCPPSLSLSWLRHARSPLSSSLLSLYLSPGLCPSPSSSSPSILVSAGRRWVMLLAGRLKLSPSFSLNISPLYFSLCFACSHTSSCFVSAASLHPSAFFDRSNIEPFLILFVFAQFESSLTSLDFASRKSESFITFQSSQVDLHHPSADHLLLYVSWRLLENLFSALKQFSCLKQRYIWYFSLKRRRNRNKMCFNNKLLLKSY